MNYIYIIHFFFIKGRQLSKGDIDEAGPSSQLTDVDSKTSKVEV